ncbi:PQQ-dependent sugar dehydrogenase [Horticoccus sp. 23ND18S-11]|uniref:PQQ-dependent sugar dehydrogenase n=1 Tax=Horticoccus sp. 23ND18S-11 TaxID=3391832 RepID=UPI0039C9953D
MKIAVALLAFVSVAPWAPSQPQPRTPWTTSRVKGNPEPPKAFVAEAVFPRLAFSQAIELATVPGSNRLIMVERRGKISSFPTRGDPAAADLVLDLLPLQPKLDHAFGVVLHPRFRETRQIFVCYALTEGLPEGTRVSRFTLTSLDPLRADPASEEVILTWKSGGHNGGNLQFGPDGYLYISTGDAGPAAPPDLYNTGQDLSDLLSSIVRIDVDQRDPGKAYRVPSDNPWFAAPGSAATSAIRPELWAYGLRNPWKMSFDRATGNLWCGDIGWELWEMVHLITRGGNYGWSAYEASQPIKPALVNPGTPITPPVVAHPHAEAASITGGFVYHGKQFPELANAYVYGDWVTGKIWALWHDGKQITRHEEIADTPHAIITFGQDDDGELYYAHYADASTLHRLVRNPHASATAAFPRTLGATGLFADVARLQPAPGVYPFAINSPKWDDGLAAQRHLALPDTMGLTTTVTVRRDPKANTIKADYATRWPAGAVLARTLTLGDRAVTTADRAKPIETQVLHYDGEAWNAYSYRWNAAGTDADLVPAEGAETTVRVAADPHAAGPRTREATWRFASRAECLRCHSTWHNGALAFTPAQLRGAGVRQTATLIDHGLVNADFFEQTRLGGESSVGENRSARALLHANCAPCHTEHAGGAVAIFLNQELLTPQLNVVDVPPTQGRLGLKDPKLIAPGDPWSSVLAVRMAKLGSGHMPLIGSREIDVEGLKVIEDWIARMPSVSTAPKPWTATTWDRAAIEEGLASVSGAMRLRRAIDDGRLDATQRTQAFAIAWASGDATVRDLFERFKPEELRERTLGAVIDAPALLRLSGDAARGAQLLAPDGKLAACRACHFIQGQGRQFGPDLSRIGAQQSAAQILESILTPSKIMAPLYRPTVVELRDGTSQAGFVRARGAKEIVLTIATGQSIKIPLADIRAEQTLTTSLMPEGQLQGLTAQEAADLVAYLASLK